MPSRTPRRTGLCSINSAKLNNIQKNYGCELEHAYCSQESAVKSFSFVLQVAHAINHLMIKGSLLPNFDELLGSLRHFLRQVARSFAGCVIAAVDWG